MQEYNIVEIPVTPPDTPRVTSGHRPRSSMVKSVTVDMLALILAWKPSLAMLLGKLIWWLLPWLREA